MLNFKLSSNQVNWQHFLFNLNKGIVTSNILNSLMTPVSKLEVSLIMESNVSTDYRFQWR